MSRLEKIRSVRKDPEYEPDMPPLDGGAHLIGYLLEVGPTMNMAPVTHEELRAWQSNIGVALQPWEIRFIRRLSYDYLQETHLAAKADRPAPWKPDLPAVGLSMQAAIIKMAQL